VTCAKCHAPNAAGLVRYKPLETTCESCHADVHVGQFAPMGCASCHTTAAFKPASGFSHGPPFTTFLLEGKHADVACKACHPSAKVASGATVQRFVGAPTTCEGCHSDFHKGAFQGFVP
jgi:Zn finger protein HypA/HybF involved in hydrogenase expression